MPHRHKPQVPSDELPRTELTREFEELEKERETDSLLDALERDLKAWAPEEETEKDRENSIDKMNREMIAKSVFREMLDSGYHEEMADLRPIESEVRRGLEELKNLIAQGKHSPPR